MSFIILGSDGFVASSLKNYLKIKNEKYKSISKKEINFLHQNSSLKLKKILKNKKNINLVVISAIAPAKTFDDYLKNISMILNIIKEIKKKSINKIIYISSDAVYSDTKKKINESSDTNPTTIHGMMHLHRENILKLLFQKKLLIIRPTLLFGKNDSHNGYGPNKFMRVAMKNEQITLFGKGEEKRDHLYIGDLVKLIYLAASKKNFTGILNAVSSEVISFYDLSLKIKKLCNLNKKIKFKKRNGPMHHLGLRRFDNLKIKKNFKNFNFSKIDNVLKEYL